MQRYTRKDTTGLENRNPDQEGSLIVLPVSEIVALCDRWLAICDVIDDLQHLVGRRGFRGRVRLFT